MQQEEKKTRDIVKVFANFYYSLSDDKKRRVEDFLDGVTFTSGLKENENGSGNTDK